MGKAEKGCPTHPPSLPRRPFTHLLALHSIDKFSLLLVPPQVPHAYRLAVRRSAFGVPQCSVIACRLLMTNCCGEQRVGRQNLLNSAFVGTLSIATSEGGRRGRVP